MRRFSEKYGQGDEHHHIDTRLWTEASEFLMGLSAGRSWHYTTFEKEKIWVQIGLRAKSFLAAYYVLIYENKKLGARVKEQSKDKEKGAL